MKLFTNLMVCAAVSTLCNFANAAQWQTRTVKNPLDGYTYSLNNNPWGDSGATLHNDQFTYSATLSKKGGVVWTDTWSWPNGPVAAKAAFDLGYPECQLKGSWPIASLHSVRSIWHYKLHLVPGVQQGYDVAYDYYVVDTQPGTASRTEIMIWTNYHYDGPIGKKVGSLHTAGTIWDVYFGMNGQMPVYSYLLHKGVMDNVDMDLLPFIKRGLEMHLKNSYAGYGKHGVLNEIDEGIEVHTGSGSLATSEVKTVVR